MTLKSLALIALGTLAVIACGQQQSGTGTTTTHCTSGQCQIAVTIANNDCSNAANILLDKDPLNVPKGAAHNIQWTIKTDHYVWVPAPGGITGLPAAVFTNPHDNGAKYDIHDANPETTPTDHKYAVHLKKDDGTLCAVKDPVIRNGS